VASGVGVGVGGCNGRGVGDISGVAAGVAVVVGRSSGVGVAVWVGDGVVVGVGGCVAVAVGEDVAVGGGLASTPCVGTAPPLPNGPNGTKPPVTAARRPALSSSTAANRPQPRLNWRCSREARKPSGGGVERGRRGGSGHSGRTPTGDSSPATRESAGK